MWGLIQKLRQQPKGDVHEEERNDELEKEQQTQQHKQQQQNNKQTSKKKKNESTQVTPKEEEVSETESQPSCETTEKQENPIVIDKEEEERRQALLIEKERELEAGLELLEENLMEEEENWNKKTKHPKRPHSNKIKSPLADKSIEYQLLPQQEEEEEVDDKSLSHMEEKQLQWTQSQQRQLELALKKYGKDEENRWEHIAELVPDKTKVMLHSCYSFK